MLQVARDNLALTGILGYIKSFKADYFSTVFFATQNDIQCKPYDYDFELRNLKNTSRMLQPFPQPAERILGKLNLILCLPCDRQQLFRYNVHGSTANYTS
jgi:hypothetical protein